MIIVYDKISLAELKDMSEKMYCAFVKTVVDVEKQIIAVDVELHADGEFLLLENGSKQTNLWGINLYPSNFASKDWIEFNSMINLRPAAGNRSRFVDNPDTQQIILKTVNNLVQN